MSVQDKMTVRAFQCSYLSSLLVLPRTKCLAATAAFLIATMLCFSSSIDALRVACLPSVGAISCGQPSKVRLQNGACMHVACIFLAASDLHACQLLQSIDVSELCVTFILLPSSAAGSALCGKSATLSSCISWSGLLSSCITASAGLPLATSGTAGLLLALDAVLKSSCTTAAVVSVVSCKAGSGHLILVKQQRQVAAKLLHLQAAAAAGHGTQLVDVQPAGQRVYCYLVKCWSSWLEGCQRLVTTLCHRRP